MVVFIIVIVPTAVHLSFFQLLDNLLNGFFTAAALFIPLFVRPRIAVVALVEQAWSPQSSSRPNSICFKIASSMILIVSASSERQARQHAFLCGKNRAHWDVHCCFKNGQSIFTSILPLAVQMQMRRPPERQWKSGCMRDG